MKKKGNKRKMVAAGSSNSHSTKDEKINPFELRINRERYSVLGRKIKHGRGKPGFSRNKANKNRMEFFQKSSQLTQKSNAFIDKRIGEYDDDDSVLKEDLVAARMTQARRKKYKKNIYNLNEQENLTHFGQPISNLETMDCPEDSSEDDDEAQLNADFVNKAHFGGFLSKKVEQEMPKTHKEILDNLIYESKRKKEEKKAAQELNEELTEKLDEKWKEVLTTASSMKRNDSLQGFKRGTYDITLHELRFEPRAAATNSLKPEEQKKKDEENLKRMESERISRMKPVQIEKRKDQLEISADSIYDGLHIENNFQENHLLVDEVKENEYSEFQSASSESDANSDVDEEGRSEITFNVENSDDNEIIKPIIEMKGGGNSLFNNAVPQAVDEFSKQVHGHSAEEISLIIESIIKNNRQNLNAENKVVLEKLFTVLIMYLCSSENCGGFSCVEVLNKLVPHLYILAEYSPLKTGLSFKNIILEKIALYQKGVSSKNSPSLDFLVVLKLCSILYPTSDFRHPMVTPCMLLMSDILSKPYKVTPYNLLTRLFLSNLFLEYISFSKRLATEPIHFLQDILYLASSNDSSQVNYVPKYRTTKEMKKLFFIDTKVDDDPSPISLKVFNFLNTQGLTLNLKISILFSAVTLLYKFAELYLHEATFTELFSTTGLLSEKLPLSMYPITLINAIDDLKSVIKKGCNKCRTYLTFPNKKPPTLKMLEPSYNMNFTENQNTFAKKLKIEKQLSQKIKKEEKGIIREMRRDAQFLARQQLKEKMEADEERRIKVKKLFHDLSVQQGEYKKFSKKK